MKLKQQLCEKCRAELRVLRAKMNKMAAAGASVYTVQHLITSFIMKQHLGNLLMNYFENIFCTFTMTFI